MVKLQEYNRQFSVTIPKNIVKKIGWEKGTDIYININEKGKLELEKL